MAVSKSVLGMNARNFLYIRPFNSTKAKRIADNKLRTKQLLLRHFIATPNLLGRFPDRRSIAKFNWTNLPSDGFVIKPARGYGGSGILAFKDWKGDHGTTISGETYDLHRIESHLLDILDGAYSLQYLPDKAYIEERITPHHFFRKLAPLGLPDIRIIVFNHIPIMAMLRLPTAESKGKANLHLGAIALGIDIRTGITTYAVSHNQTISYLPWTKTKVGGIKIPDWDKLLLLASEAQATSGLGYAGVDIVVDIKKGPLVLEINARPGLSIQIANLASLRTRLERIEDMEIPSPARGVEVAKSLFASGFTEKVAGPKILEVIHELTIANGNKLKTIHAKLDTGAYRSSIDQKLAEELELPVQPHTLLVKAASGQQVRKTVKVTFVLAGKKITTITTITDRSHMQFPMIVGRRDLKGFYINPVFSAEPGDRLDELDQEREETKE